MVLKVIQLVRSQAKDVEKIGRGKIDVSIRMMFDLCTEMKVENRISWGLRRFDLSVREAQRMEQERVGSSHCLPRGSVRSLSN